MMGVLHDGDPQPAPGELADRAFHDKGFPRTAVSDDLNDSRGLGHEGRGGPDGP